MPKNIVACRPHSYHPFEHVAYAHLAGLGVRHVEIEVAETADAARVRDELAQHGLRASSVQGQCDVTRPDVAEQIAAQMPVLETLGARLLFLSVKAGDTSLDDVYARLRSGGDVAAERGVTLVLETHPDLITNAAVARRTIEGVAHPAVRVNFDTANLYFYNENVNAATELREIVEFVAAVHLKETDGGYRHWHFPALGRGVVPFGEVFEILDEAGYAGPLTLEIEGVEGEEKTEQLVCDRIAESVEYLRGLGRF